MSTFAVAIYDVLSFKNELLIVLAIDEKDAVLKVLSGLQIPDKWTREEFNDWLKYLKEDIKTVDDIINEVAGDYFISNVVKIA